MGLTFEIETFKLVKSRLSDWKMIDLYFYRTLVICQKRLYKSAKEKNTNLMDKEAELMCQIDDNQFVENLMWLTNDTAKVNWNGNAMPLLQFS